MFELMSAFILAAETAIYVIPMAAQERGYSGAYGGEVFLIILAAIVGMYLGHAVKEGLKKFLA